MKKVKTQATYKMVQGKPKMVAKSVTATKIPRFMSADQRHKIQLAKLNQSTAKSAISEVGRTVREVGAQVAGIRGYKTYVANQANKRSNGSSVDSALKVYNQIVNGNPDQSGESGEESTTMVGGSGSRIGG